MTNFTNRLFLPKLIILFALLFGFCGITAAQEKVTVVEVGSEFVLRNTSLGADSSFWDFGDGTTSTEWHAIHQYESPGSYTVRLIIKKNTCTEIVEKSFLVAEFGENGSIFQAVTLYPNPVIDQAWLKLPPQFAGEFTINLIDQQGKVLKNWSETVEGGQKDLQMNLSDLAQGIYFLHLFNAQEESTVKFIKQ